MKRREWLLAALGVLLLLVGARMVRASHDAMHDVVLPDACRTPVRVLEPRALRPGGSAVVFHGLSANRRLMLTLGQWLATAGLRVFLIDSPGHGDSTEPFSPGRTEQCAAAVITLLEQRHDIEASRAVFVGHSMGGATAVRLADRFPAAATIAISPAPTHLPRRLPSNVLILSAQFDLPQLRETAQKLLRAAGGERVQPEDFHQRRAARLEILPQATHTSLIFDPRAERVVADWARQALGEAGPALAPPGWPLAGSALGLIGLVLIFPLVASSLASALRTKQEIESAPPIAARVLVANWIVAALFAVGLLNLWVPLRTLRLLTGDYLGSFLLITGALLLPLLRKEAMRALALEIRAIVLGLALGMVTLLAFGAWLNWQMTDAWMNAARWLRFVPLALVTLPYFFAEEIALGPPTGPRRWQRWALFLALRLVLWLGLLFALFAFNSGEILVLLLGMYVAAMSLAQRWGSNAVRRRTGSAAAAALFGAILAAWFLAVVFPLT